MINTEIARFLTFILSALLALIAPVYGAPSNGSRGAGVMVHLFEWKWTDIARECEAVLGPIGISAVQVSPPNEHIDQRLLEAPDTNSWWARYQPVSYRLVSRSGDEREFKSMVKRCHAVGVDIYADAVINHMGDKVGVGIAGTRFDVQARSYADYDESHFHQYCEIQAADYQWSENEPLRSARAARIRACQISALPDLDTGNEDVQATLAAYLQSLLDHGVSGIRIDAAKHILPADLAAILGHLKGEYQLFQEVIDDGRQPLSAREYLSNGAVTEFRYGLALGTAFKQGSLHRLARIGTDAAWVPSDSAIVFIDNHDTQRGHGMGNVSISHRDGVLYELANIFMLAWPYGRPKLMSSYDWGGEDGGRGPPLDTNGNTLEVYASGGVAKCGAGTWLCEHRSPTILKMLGFRRYVTDAGADTTAHWWDNGAGQIAFARSTAASSAGFVVINREQRTLRERLQTGLPAGSYCDIAVSTFTPASSTCSGSVIKVSEDGLAMFEVAPLQAAVIHGGTLLP